jgi:hypothetical protein
MTQKVVILFLYTVRGLYYYLEFSLIILLPTG